MRLFSSRNLSEVLRQADQKLPSEMEHFHGNQLLTMNLDELYENTEQRYRFNVPTLVEDKITADTREVDVDVRHDFLRDIEDKSRPFYVKGTEYAYTVPFRGDGALFDCRPSTYGMSPPTAEVRNGKLVLSYSRTDHDTAAVKAEFEKDLVSIKQYLNTMHSDVEAHNASIKGNARALVQTRREKLLKDQEAAKSLGYPKTNDPKS